MKSSDSGYIKKFINSILEKSKNIIIVPHEVTDHDSFASAVALREILKKIGGEKINVFAYVPEPSLELMDFLTKVGFNEKLDEENELMKKILSGHEKDFIIVLVDISSPNRFNNENIRNMIANAKDLFVIDHHRVEEKPKNFLFFKKTSTSEIILQIAKEFNILESILENRILSNLLIAGILVDSSFLYNADEETFKWLGILFRFGDYRKVYSMLRTVKRDISERIAKIKGAKRAEMIRVEDKIILVSEAGAYEASIASALIGLGANIAIVISEKKQKGKKVYRVSARGSSLDLSKIFANLAKKIGGSGGGHPSAAGLVVNVEKVKDKKELIKMILEELLKNMR